MIQKKLPETEFEIMRIIWNLPEPVTSSMIMNNLEDKDWKQQTVVTLLTRLEKKGFLRSEKQKKEREFYSLVSEDDYMRFETVTLFSKFKKGSFSGLVTALYDNGAIDDESIAELQKWLDERK